MGERLASTVALAPKGKRAVEIVVEEMVQKEFKRIGPWGKTVTPIMGEKPTPKGKRAVEIVVEEMVQKEFKRMGH